MPTTHPIPELSGPTDPTLHSRRLLIGAAMIAQPILGLAEHILDPKQGTDRLEHAAAVIGHPGAQLASILVGLAAVLLFLPVVLGLVHLTRTRAPSLSRTGGGLALTGLVAYAALHGVDLAVLEVARSGAAPADVAALMGTLEGGAGGVLMMAFLIGMLIGTLLLAVGLWRAGSVPRTATALILAFLVIDSVGAAGGILAISIVAHSLLIIGSGWIGIAILRTNDLAWQECTPLPAGAAQT